MSEQKHVKDAFERYRLIIQILKENNDKAGLELLDELINACSWYVIHLADSEREFNRMTHGGRTELIDTEVMDWQERTDKIRVRYHNNIIRSVEILNGLCPKS